jgi:hypothetical protein
VMAHWRHFQSMYEDFSVAQRRLIGRYPKKWKRIVLERARELVAATTNSDMQVKRMEERLISENSRYKFFKESCADYVVDRVWLDNAIAHQPPFDAIVAMTSPMNNRRICLADDLLKSNAPYHRELQVTIPRTAEAIIGAAARLLYGAADVVLVEPNFNVSEPRFVRVILRLIETLEENANSPKRFELHTTQPQSGLLPDVQRKNFRRTFEPYLPSGWLFDICFWAESAPKDRLHPRFILTERGGIQFDYGLDEGEPGTTTIATGLGDKLFSELFARYAVKGVLFTSDGKNVTIQITG